MMPAASESPPNVCMRIHPERKSCTDLGMSGVSCLELSGNQLSGKRNLSGPSRRFSWS